MSPAPPVSTTSPPRPARHPRSAVQRLYGLPEHALIDMGDFVGGTLKYLRRHPVPRLTLAGGFAKLAKLAAGHLDLHSGSSRIDPACWPLCWRRPDARRRRRRRRDPVTARAKSSPSPDRSARLLAESVARRAREVALATLSGGTMSRSRSSIAPARFSRMRHARPQHARPQHPRPQHIRPRRHRRARRLLILGGTAEAASLARAIPLRFGEAIEVTTALAGRTRNPGPIAGFVRIGGFGGEAGLAAWLIEHRIDFLIDATHPFAAEIARSARLAAERTGIRRLMLLRPRWKRHPLDRWIEVDGLAAAASLVGRLGRCALLTVGAGGAAAFAQAEDRALSCG